MPQITMRNDALWACAHVLALSGHAILGLIGIFYFLSIPLMGAGGADFRHVIKFWVTIFAVSMR